MKGGASEPTTLHVIHPPSLVTILRMHHDEEQQHGTIQQGARADGETNLRKVEI